MLFLSTSTIIWLNIISIILAIVDNSPIVSSSDVGLRVDGDELGGSVSVDVYPAGHTVMFVGRESSVTIVVLSSSLLTGATMNGGRPLCLTLTSSDSTVFNISNNLVCLPPHTNDVMTSHDSRLLYIPPNHNKHVNSELDESGEHLRESNLSLRLIAGPRTGHGWLNIAMETRTSPDSVTSRVHRDSVTSRVQYRVTVVHHDARERDVMFVVTCVAQLMTLLVIGLRVRPQELKEVVERPYGLVASTIMQTLIVPLVSDLYLQSLILQK